MATKAFTDVRDKFPASTSVSAYPATAKRDGGPPPGTAVATATVQASGSLTFTGLPDQTDLVAYAAVSGQHRYVGFSTKESRAGQATSNVTKRTAPTTAAPSATYTQSEQTTNKNALDAVILALKDAGIFT